VSFDSRLNATNFLASDASSNSRWREDGAICPKSLKREHWDRGRPARLNAVRRELGPEGSRFDLPGFLSNLTTFSDFFCPSVFTAWHKLAGV
jgi:hypothetical protein